MRRSFLTQGASGLLFAALVFCGCSSDKMTSDPGAPIRVASARSMPYRASTTGRTNGYAAASGVGRSDPTTQAVDLPTVMRLASGRNLDVNFVREQLREAHADMVNASWWALPTIRPAIRFNSVNGNQQNTPGRILDVDKHNSFAGAGVFVDWELGDLLYEHLAAVQRRSASRHAVRATVNDATLEAAEGYLDLLRAQTALAIAELALDLYEKLVAETKAQVEAGGGFRGDELRARARLSHAIVLQRKAEREQRTAALKLREILNLPSTVELYASEGTPVMLTMIDANQSEEELLRLAMIGRPELREARLTAKAALADRRKTTMGPWIPRVTAGWEGGGFGQDFNTLGGASDIGVGVQWRIGRDGIGGKARQAAAAARERQSRVNVKQVNQRIVREVAVARNQVLTQAQAMEAAEAGVKDAKEALDLYQQRQEIGVGIPLDTIVAQETYTAAQIDFLDAVIGHNKAQVRLMRAIGQMP